MKTVIRSVRLNIQLLWLDELRMKMNKTCEDCQLSIPVDQTK